MKKKINNTAATTLLGVMVLSTVCYQSQAYSVPLNEKGTYPNTANLKINVAQGKFNQQSFKNIAARWNSKVKGLNIHMSTAKDSIPLSEGKYGENWQGCYKYYFKIDRKTGNKIFSRAKIFLNNRTIDAHYEKNKKKANHCSKKELIYHILTHELGHALGLADYPPEGFPTIMRYGCASENLGGPTKYDIQGVEKSLGLKNSSSNNSFKPNAQVTGNKVNVRKGAGSSKAVLFKLNKGTKIQTISKSGSWYKIKCSNGKTGYIHSNQIKMINSSSSKTRSLESDLTGVYSTSVNLKLRSGASTSSKHILTIPSDTEVLVLSFEGDWAKVLYDQKEGYVFAEYLEKTGILYSYSVSESKEDLVVGSDEIINGIIKSGEIKSLNIGTNENPLNSLYYVVNIEINTVLKGSLKEGDTIQVKFPLNYLEEKADELNLEENSEVALFLTSYEENMPYSPLNMTQAIINIDNSKARAKEQAVIYNNEEQYGEPELFNSTNKSDLFNEIKSLI